MNQDTIKHGTLIVFPTSIVSQELCFPHPLHFLTFVIGSCMYNIKKILNGEIHRYSLLTINKTIGIFLIFQD